MTKRSGGKRTIVVGGGAAGLMAAGLIAEAGGRVAVFEKMDSAARKLRITGKGRCNLTNSADLKDFLAHFGKSGRFLNQAFRQYFSHDLIEFFRLRGLEVQFERGGRVFPEGNDAPAVARVLLDWVRESGADIQTGRPVTGVIVENDRVAGVVSGGVEYEADNVILATGGKSYPRTGSTGDGYTLAGSVGHTVTPCLPSLVSLKTGKGAVKGLNGLNLRNVAARLYVEGSRKGQAFGELTFTPSGIGGPIILTLSPVGIEGLRGGKSVSLRIDLKPALDDGKLDARLLRDFEKRSKEPMESVLRGLMPAKMVPFCLQHAGIDADMLAGQVPAKTRKRLRIWLKDLRFEITGHGSWDEAIVTSGGVKTSEVDPKTMESRLVKGLYLAGELLDIQADTGGFNLQAAFSTGWVAGRSIIEKLTTR